MSTLDASLRLDARVALRPEPFGALAYHYDTRKLIFLRHPDVVRVVESLGDHPTVEEALRACGIADTRWPSFTAAIDSLSDAGLLTERSRGAGQELSEPQRASRGSSGQDVRSASGAHRSRGLRDRGTQLRHGLDAPICLTWELTYACNLACVHCLSSSGRRDPRELTTDEAKAVLDELRRLQVFYINIGGGEPMLRRDFFDLVEYAVAPNRHGGGIGVKFSTNGTYLDAAAARRLTELNYLDVQISLDGTDAATNDHVRGPGSYGKARQAMDHLAAAGFGPFKISVVVTRHNVAQLDEFKALADSYGAQLRITRLRPSGRGADSWHELHPTNDQQREIFQWLLVNGDPRADLPVLTGDSFFHLNALAASPHETLPGLNMCGAGRVVCLIDPVGDVYACPFVIHDEFKAGSVRDAGGFTTIWRDSPLFRELRQPDSAGACSSCGSYDACQGGCMAAKFFTGLPLDGPDPECVNGHGESALLASDGASVPRPSMDHSRPVAFLGRSPASTRS